MPTRNISLTPRQHAFIAKLVDSGEYQNASEAVRDALRVLQERRKQDALKLKALRALINEGIEELERGNYVELDETELGPYIRSLASARNRPAR